MIGRITGSLIEKEALQVLVEAGGIGYEIMVPMTTLEVLGETGTQVVLHTHFSVREDAQVLYGFKSQSDRAYFRELIKVNGVGPKMALAILSSVDAHNLAMAVTREQVSTLTRVPGIGKKTAERLIMELKDKMENLAGGELASYQADAASTPASIAAAQSSGVDSNENEAVSALTALGYKPKEAQNAIHKVKDQADNAEQMIRMALQSMMRS